MKKLGPTQQSAESVPINLNSFNESYAAADVRDKWAIPDGIYSVRVENVKLTRSRKGKAILVWDLLVLAGLFAGRHLFKTVAITNASLPIIKADLLLLGLNLATFSSLPEHLAMLVGKTLSATKHTKNEYVNVYFES